jgi:putative glutamine amidotransferase
MGSKEYRVLVTGSNSGSKWAYFLIDYMISQRDIDTIFISPNRAKFIPTSFDGLIISGGVDINPKLYSNSIDPTVKKIEPRRDELELKLLDIAIKKKVPILGICRGMQLINVYFGGTLYQDIPKLKLKYPHKSTIFPLTRVKIEKRSKLFKILNRSTIYVNSIHHQAVDKLGKNLRVNAYDRNRIVEGIESVDNRYLIGVQWHPEYIFYKEESRKIFDSFIKAVRG